MTVSHKIECSHFDDNRQERKTSRQALLIISILYIEVRETVVISPKVIFLFKVCNKKSSKQKIE